MTRDSGFLLIDKAEGLSSFDVIRSLRRITSIRSIGHTGTLDPFATGLLICCIGKHTRLAQYVEAEDKSYMVHCKFGSLTDTGDTEGQTIQSAAFPSALPFHQELTEAVLGLSALPVPAYSAIKINGKRAYKYAREGVEVEMPVRACQISSFEIHSLNEECISYTCTVSKGTYIRSLSQWIAVLCGSLGNTTSLRRIAIGNTHVDRALSLDELAPDTWQKALIPDSQVLSGYPSHIASTEELADLRNGRGITLELADHDHLMIYDTEGKLRSVVKLKDGTALPKLNLNYD